MNIIVFIFNMKKYEQIKVVRMKNKGRKRIQQLSLGFMIIVV